MAVENFAFKTWLILCPNVVVVFNFDLGSDKICGSLARIRGMTGQEITEPIGCLSYSLCNNELTRIISHNNYCLLIYNSIYSLNFSQCLLYAVQ